jgi:hypothetical protein
MTTLGVSRPSFQAASSFCGSQRSESERGKKLSPALLLVHKRTYLRSLHVIQSVFQGGDDVDYRAVQKGWGWFVVPLSMRRVQDYVIPIESSAQAAGRLYFWRLGGRPSIQLLGDKMLGVPKLGRSLVCDSTEGAAAWRRKIRGQDRLPDDQDAELRV